MKNLEKRLEEKIEYCPTTGCWLWIAAQDGRGYGVVQNTLGQKQLSKAHRVIYRSLIGPIPEDLTLDHLCKTTICVNPDHLEPVTHRENVLRGDSPSAKNAKKSTCPRGHSYNAVDNRGGRYCNLCALDNVNKRRDKRLTDGVCVYCGGIPEKDKRMCQPCLDRSSIYLRNYRRRKREE